MSIKFPFKNTKLHSRQYRIILYSYIVNSTSDHLPLSNPITPPILHSEIAPNSEGTRRFKAALSLNSQLHSRFHRLGNRSQELNLSDWQIPFLSPKKGILYPMKRNKEPYRMWVFWFCSGHTFFFQLAPVYRLSPHQFPCPP